MIGKDSELERIEEVFQAAADLAGEEREAYLERECSGEPSLLVRVRAMLADLVSGASLRAPVLAVSPRVPSEGPGTVIGRYKLLQEIGEGGFGVVYMAEQEEPIVRRVALKIIKLGMDTKEVVARFEAERQALAMMDHPNIARVLDGGATDSGRPFFVMELVRGKSVTDYCDENRLTTIERLRLFVDVCNAVQHAHQKGVIHRDLKPTNVMVTLHDGKPVVKVIDFGVAKAMHARLTEKTLFTAYGRFIGTPAYMSPEQAELSGLDVDTRSDIYSLGVLLYELLTGTTPFDLKDVFEEGLLAVQRTIREVSPERPSLRISTSRDATIATRRGIELPGLTKLLRGDLDWIVMKCLEKERVRRYDTANELATDIERHLSGQPVLAGPPSAGYRLRKFLGRNRAAALSVGVLLLGLIVGLVGLGLGFLRAEGERRLAVEESRRTRDVTDFLIDTIALSDPRVARRPDLSIATFLATVSERADVVLRGRPADEARLSIAIGRGYKGLGEYQLAAAHLRDGIEQLRSVEEHDRAELYDATWDLVHVLFYIEDPDALAVAMEAREVAHAHIAERWPDVASVLTRFKELVNASSFEHDEEASRKVPIAFEETVRATNRIPRGDPLWPIIAEEWVSAGYTIWYGVLDPLTIELFGRAVEVMQRELPANDPTLAETLGLYVNALNRNGRAEEAGSEIQSAVERMRLVLPPGNPQLVQIESMLGENLVGRGLYAEAEPLLVAGYESVLDTWGHELTNFFVVEALLKLLSCYDGWGEGLEAQPYRVALREACARSQYVLPWPHVRRALGPEHEELLVRMDALQAVLGDVHYIARPPVASEEDVRLALVEVVDEGRRRFAADELLEIVFHRTVLLWMGAIEGHSEFQERTTADCLRVLDPYAERFPAELADGHARLAEVLLERGEDAEALNEARVAHGLVLGRSGDWVLAVARARVARPLVELGLHEEAEELLRVAQETLEAHFGAASADASAAGELRARNLRALGRDEEADALAR